MTAGHLATCPRMLKTADALAERYHVRVVSTNHTAWAREAGAESGTSPQWQWTVVDHDRQSPSFSYAWTGARQRGAIRAASRFGPGRVPLGVAIRAFSRSHAELVRAALSERFDFVYGGTTGALAAVAEAAQVARVPYALDLEDFHSGEHDAREGRLANQLASRIERTVLPQATFLTTSWEAIADAYADRYGRRPIVVHNTFPLPSVRPEAGPIEPGALRLYWFSQSIGEGRGLEEVVEAAGLARTR